MGTTFTNEKSSSNNQSDNFNPDQEINYMACETIEETEILKEG